ncbi:unnamed protein product, partial [Aureobasidium pullulans]
TLIHAKMSQIASSMALQRQLARSGPQFAKTSLPRVQSRSLQDIAITRTGKPIIRISGGRSSLGGHTATVFGATGFLGRYIVNRLGTYLLDPIPYSNAEHNP